ncbi:hypothetical protein GYA49_05625 [Candidatus Beckwithbacteria bacterium]|nr:hypothetical protein [Candidatus Beckwithbacteria bacterium]
MMQEQNILRFNSITSINIGAGLYWIATGMLNESSSIGDKNGVERMTSIINRISKLIVNDGSLKQTDLQIRAKLIAILDELQTIDPALELSPMDLWELAIEVYSQDITLTEEGLDKEELFQKPEKTFRERIRRLGNQGIGTIVPFKKD